MQSSIEKLSQARQWLAEAKTMDDVKHIIDVAGVVGKDTRSPMKRLFSYSVRSSQPGGVLSRRVLLST